MVKETRVTFLGWLLEDLLYRTREKRDALSNKTEDYLHSV